MGTLTGDDWQQSIDAENRYNCFCLVATSMCASLRYLVLVTVIVQSSHTYGEICGSDCMP